MIFSMLDFSADGWVEGTLPASVDLRFGMTTPSMASGGAVTSQLTTSDLSPAAVAMFQRAAAVRELEGVGTDLLKLRLGQNQGVDVLGNQHSEEGTT